MIALDKKREKEKKLVSTMIRIYCRGKHGTKGLCQDCEALERYAHRRIQACPFMATKSFCSKCQRPCYLPSMRDKMRKVMGFSGPRMIFYRPFTAIRHGIASLWLDRKESI